MTKLKGFRTFIALIVLGTSASLAEGRLILDFESIRTEEADYIYVHGGYYDGAAGGQTTTFVVTEDDRLRCFFESEQMVTIESTSIEYKTISYDQVLPGVYDALYGVLDGAAQQTVAPTKSPEDNFFIEVSESASKRWAVLNWEDDGFLSLGSFFADTPHQGLTGGYEGCWAFG